MSITHHEAHEEHEKKIKVFGKEFEKEPLFKKVCLNLSECEENKIFMNFMLFMV